MKILIDFNSIKVQLKLQISIPLYVSDILFQFHKGTIKTFYEYLLHHHHLHFNSIKVQLKLPKRETEKASVFQFQFHKGTIKT